MNKRLLDYDPFTGVATYHAYDDATRTTYIEEVQDVEPFLEANKATQNSDPGGAMGLSWRSRKQIKAGWWHVASIPVGVQMQWMKKGVNLLRKEDWPKVRRLLNDPDWRYLRTGLGKV